MSLVDALPDRPLRPSEWEAIEEAGEYDVVRPATTIFGEDMVPFEGEDEAAEDLVIVAGDWYAGISREVGGWEVIFREDRPEDAPGEELWAFAVERLHEELGHP